jgi:hypothetical protein
MGKRAGKTELQQRLDMLMGLKAQGHSTSSLLKAGMACWHVSEREIQRYLTKIKEYEAQIALAEPIQNLGQYKLRLEYLYAQAVAEKNLALAHEIIDSQIKLEQTRSKVKQIGGQNEIPSSLIPVPESTELARLLDLCQRQKPTSTG